jgi:Flp pilus assembly protein TadG
MNRASTRHVDTASLRYGMLRRLANGCFTACGKLRESVSIRFPVPFAQHDAMDMSHHFFSALQQAMRRRRLFRSNSRGVAAVEFALVAPIFVAMLVVIVDVGRFVYYRTVIIGAVSAGAHFAVLAAQNGTAIGTVSTEAASVTQTQSQDQLTAADVTVTVNNGSPSTNVCCVETSGTTTTWTCAATPPTCGDGSNPGV